MSDEPITKHEWPYPSPFEPGKEYLWCPTSSLDAMIGEGWEQTIQDHRYENVRFTLLKKGEALKGVEAGTVVPEMFVIVQEVEEAVQPKAAPEPEVQTTEVINLG